MKFIALKTKDGKLKGDIFFYCRTLHVSRQGFYQYLANKDRGSNGNGNSNSGNGNSSSNSTGNGNATNAETNNSQNQSGIQFPIASETSDTESYLIGLIKTSD